MEETSDVCSGAQEHSNRLQPNTKCPNFELCDLHDDCLLEVFAYLSFDDLLLLSDVCQRFLQLVRCHLRKICQFDLNYRKLMEYPAKEDRLASIFRTLGPNLTAFRFSGGFIMNEQLKQSIFRHLRDNCPRLRHLTINYVALTEENLQTLRPLADQLVALDFGMCDLDDDALDVFLQNAGNLRTLVIAGNSRIKGTFFDNWTNCSHLEQLDMHNCYSLNVGQLDSFLDHATNLMFVDAVACPWMPRNKDIFERGNRSVGMGTDIPNLKYFTTA